MIASLPWFIVSIGEAAWIDLSNRQISLLAIFYCVVYFKDGMCHRNSQMAAELKHYIFAACETIPAIMLTRVSMCFVREQCHIVAVNGGYTDILKISLFILCKFLCNTFIQLFFLFFF